jgi:type III pantothenate kinase
MLLVVDIGNTETVLGLYDEENLRAHWRLSSKQHRTSDECWILVKIWCETDGFSLSDVKHFVICSVVPSLTAVYVEVSQKHLGIEPLVITAEMDTGLRVLYDTPRAVGADRICNAVAGYVLHGGPLIIVDFGTATTFDVISERGEYLGGVIALGLMSASQELHRLAAKLPKVDLRFPPFVVGKTTEMSMQSGIMWGTVALVDGMVGKISQEMEWKNVHVVATGGVAPLVVEESEKIQVIEPFLTLEGMRLIFQRSNHRCE